MLHCDNPFWRFSLAVYDEPGVADECLALQEALGIDVNLLLFCAWIGARGRVLSDGDLTAAEERVRGWHDQVVRPLRAVRQRMKTMPEMGHAEAAALRKDIAGTELRAEQVEQAFLFAAAEDIGPAGSAPAAEAIGANVAAYLRRKAPEQPAPRRVIAAAAAYRAG